jgi:type IV secretory pathway VirB10-like protein
MPAIESPTSFQSSPPAIAKVRSLLYYLIAALAVGIGAAVLYAFHSQSRSYTQQLPVPLTTPDKAWFERDIQPPPPPPPEPVSFPQPIVQSPAPPPQPPPRAPTQPNPDAIRRREAYLRALASPLVADGWQQISAPSSQGAALPNRQVQEIPLVTAQPLMPGTANTQMAVLSPPLSPYEVKATTMIPAMLLTGIDSDVPGDIVAQVTANVYDSVTHTHLLIPQGTKVQGRVDQQSSYTERRVQEVWHRLLFPNGASLSLDAMPGHDQAGYPGLHDVVNTHFHETFGRALLLSAITAGLEIAQTGTSFRRRGFGYGYDASEIATGAVAREMGSVASESIRRGIHLPPTKEIRPGYRFNILVTRDLVFTGPYQPTLYSQWTGDEE